MIKLLSIKAFKNKLLSSKILIKFTHLFKSIILHFSCCINLKHILKSEIRKIGSSV